MLFRSCPVLKRWSHEHEQAFDKFMLYKTRVPVCGAIMLNAACDKVSLMFEYALAKTAGSLHQTSACWSKAGSHRRDGGFRKERSIKMSFLRSVLFVRCVVRSI
jgi:hypothetical protein